MSGLGLEMGPRSEDWMCCLHDKKQWFLKVFQFIAKLGFVTIWEGLGSHFKSFLGPWVTFWWFGRVLGPVWNFDGFWDPPWDHLGPPRGR